MCSNGKITPNKDDTYLLGKAKCEVSRFDDSILAIYFPSGVATTNKVLPLLEELGVNMKLYLDCDGESVYHFPEDQLHIVHEILKFQTKGKNIKPFSVKTERRQIKNK